MHFGSKHAWHAHLRLTSNGRANTDVRRTYAQFWVSTDMSQIHMETCSLGRLSSVWMCPGIPRQVGVSALTPPCLNQPVG